MGRGVDVSGYMCILWMSGVFLFVFLHIVFFSMCMLGAGGGGYGCSGAFLSFLCRYFSPKPSECSV